MKPKKVFILIPVLFALGISIAAGDETVNVRASILFEINGGIFARPEPARERVVIVERPVFVERPAVPVRMMVFEPIIILERPRPARHVYYPVNRGAPAPGHGRKLGHYKQETRRAPVAVTRPHYAAGYGKPRYAEVQKTIEISKPMKRH